MANLKSTTINDTGFLQLPAGTSVQRPSDAVSGQIRYNTELKTTEWYDSNYDAWYPTGFLPVIANGGDNTQELSIQGVSYKIHIFSSPGTSEFTVTQSGNVDVLIVAGGGGTGFDGSGGGGAGGLLYLESVFLSTGTYSLTVGAGGDRNSANNSSSLGKNGENSQFLGFVAIGGGTSGLKDGGSSLKNGYLGGSGGGAGRDWADSEGGEALQPETVSGGLGNKGGFVTNDAGSTAGGGGGAGAPGEPDYGGNCTNLSENPKRGDGGIGVNFAQTFTDQFGDNGYFAGGGGGGSWSGCDYVGQGGVGGGGHGGNQGNGFAPQSGQDNTGGGGGGAGNAEPGSVGGSGVVLIRYRI